ncbi:TetR/AcrR family transcriptional regulator [Streptomyces sp. NPDC014006]|uniref:TetR/AcrR family transcriptional regulator n=1 Tax=Streptomyces sp. NPDC014006 TaxID=3364870 RepID=UPI0036FFD169
MPSKKAPGACVATGPPMARAAASEDRAASATGAGAPVRWRWLRAGRRFLEHGYRSVTMRSVVAEADVDLALLSYDFGSRKGLCGAALAPSANPAELVARLVRECDRDSFPKRVLRQLTAVWEAPESGPALVTMFKSAVQDDAVAAPVKEAREGEVVQRLAELAGGVHARRRAAASPACRRV